MKNEIILRMIRIFDESDKSQQPPRGGGCSEEMGPREGEGEKGRLQTSKWNFFIFSLNLKHISNFTRFRNFF
jgi:hypothetical protein